MRTCDQCSQTPQYWIYAPLRIPTDWVLGWWLPVWWSLFCSQERWVSVFGNFHTLKWYHQPFSHFKLFFLSDNYPCVQCWLICEMEWLFPVKIMLYTATSATSGGGCFWVMGKRRKMQSVENSPYIAKYRSDMYSLRTANKIVIFILSAPICTPLNLNISLYFSAYRTNPQLYLACLRTMLLIFFRSRSGRLLFCCFMMALLGMLCRPNASLRGRPGLLLCLAASAARSCLFARCFCTGCLNFCPFARCCCSSCSASGGALQKLAIPVWTRPTEALKGSFPLQKKLTI